MPSMPRLCAAGIAFLAAAAPLSYAAAQNPLRTHPDPITPRVIALATPKAGAPKLTVSSPDFASMSYLDKRFFQTVAGGQNIAPGVAWTGAPTGTQSYVLVVEGEGETRADPTVHWIVYDIPATASRLPTGIPKEVNIKDPAGAINGREDSSTFRGNPDGEVGYRGPNPPKDASHPYYFEVFALDKKLALDPAQAKRAAVIEAMKGHVLASGELVIKYSADDFAKK
jgi:Raf kinase inhibitor-like YbhB/YbcL family protein